MAKKTESASAAIEVAPPPSSLALANTRDLLADVLDVDDLLASDGLEELGSEDIKISARVFNFKGVDKDDNPIPLNVFFDTVEETTVRSFVASLLTLHKSNEWREFDSVANRSVVHCRSYDRVTGTTKDNVSRKCEGCPDAEWQMISGKRTRRCGPVYNVVGVDRETHAPFVIRCKKTSLDPLKQFLNKYFIGRRVIRGKRENYPLFAFETKLSLKMSDDKKYALPVFELGDTLDRESLLRCAEEARFYREHMMPALSKAEAHDVDDDAGSKPGADFSPADFIDTSAHSAPAPAPAEQSNFF
jgi:hypothetical protein